MTINKPIQVTVLGSGDAFGTPKPGCTVKSCASNNSLDCRTRFSLIFQANGKNFLIGAAPELRQQLIANKIALKEIDAIFLTHAHYDQIGGLGEFDAIGNRPAIKLFCDSITLHEIKTRFGYLSDKKRLAPRQIETGKKITYENFDITPFQLNHHKCPCLGLRFVTGGKAIVVAVDTNADLPPKSLKLMKNADALILDGMAESLEEILLAKRDLSGKTDKEFKATVDPNKRGHMLIPEAIELSKKFNAKKTILTHLSHFNSIHKDLKARYETNNVLISFDGMKITI